MPLTVNAPDHYTHCPNTPWQHCLFRLQLPEHRIRQVKKGPSLQRTPVWNSRISRGHCNYFIRSGKRQELDLLVRQTGPWGSPREVALLPHYLNVLKKGMPWPSLHFWKSNLTPGWRSHGASYYEKTRSGKILNRPYFRAEDQITSKYSEKNLAA